MLNTQSRYSAADIATRLQKFQAGSRNFYFALCSPARAPCSFLSNWHQQIYPQE